jgi:2-phosphosulfolactate phosphatase
LSGRSVDTGLVKHEAAYLSIAECGAVSGTAVVIDVLRAYTTAAWAFHLGVERIVLTEDVDEALRLKASIPGALALKDSDPVAGFELSNSPVELQAAGGLRGRTLVQRTGHGTVGAVAAKAAEHLYCAAFVNAAATAAALRELGAATLYYIVTGDEGAAEEDRACAEYIAALVEDPSTDSGPFLRRAAASAAAKTLGRRVERGIWGVHARDVETSLEANRFDFVMRAREEAGLLTLRAYN